MAASTENKKKDVLQPIKIDHEKNNGCNNKHNNIDKLFDKLNISAEEKKTTKTITQNKNKLSLTNYTVVNALSNMGTSGVIYNVCDIENALMYILKQFKTNTEINDNPNDFISRTILMELNFYKSYTHPNITKVINVFISDEISGKEITSHNPTRYNIILDKVNMSLHDYLAKYKTKLDPILFSLNIAITIGRVLLAMHNEGIYHVDCRFENILMNKTNDVNNPIVYLCDFGMACGPHDFNNEFMDSYVDKKIDTYQSDVSKNDPNEIIYEPAAAPEILNNMSIITDRLDVFMLSKVICNILNVVINKVYFLNPERSQTDYYFKMKIFIKTQKSEFGKKGNKCLNQFFDCLFLMLSTEQCKRPTIKTCLRIFENTLKTCDEKQYNHLMKIPTSLTYIPPKRRYIFNKNINIIISDTTTNIDKKTKPDNSKDENKNIDMMLTVTFFECRNNIVRHFIRNIFTNSDCAYLIKDILVWIDTFDTFITCYENHYNLSPGEYDKFIIGLHTYAGICFVLTNTILNNCTGEKHEFLKMFNIKINYDIDEFKKMINCVLKHIDYRPLSRKVNKKILNKYKDLASISLITEDELTSLITDLCSETYFFDGVPNDVAIN